MRLLDDPSCQPEPNGGIVREQTAPSPNPTRRYGTGARAVRPGTTLTASARLRGRGLPTTFEAPLRYGRFPRDIEHTEMPCLTQSESAALDSLRRPSI